MQKTEGKTEGKIEGKKPTWNQGKIITEGKSEFMRISG